MGTSLIITSDICGLAFGRYFCTFLDQVHILVIKRNIWRCQWGNQNP